MRFRLRTPFLAFARDQIRGGLWFQPSWWGAISKVPPTHFQARIKMREVPTIRFFEDRLMRCVAQILIALVDRQRRTSACPPPPLPPFYSRTCSLSNTPRRPTPNLSRFRDRNAAIAEFDKVSSSSSFSRTIASQFVEQQLARMRGGASEEAAYKGARSWMMSEGPRLFAGLQVPEHVRAAATAKPADVANARSTADEELAQQLADVREAFAAEGVRGVSGGSAAPAAEKTRTAWRTWAGRVNVAMVAERGFSKEPVFERR